MSGFNPGVPATAGSVPHRGPFATQAQIAAPAAPAGTFAPGTKVQVGSQKVIIQKYFSEGGFAHVYLVKMPQAIDGTDIAVLKRVAVPDKEALASMRTEVETMKKLKGHRPIVTYFDSHVSQLIGGGYEVFLLMEFCNGGGLIDFMNTRLQNRLTEPEILKIFTDVAEGVATMHYLKPPLLHRDLKVENVLITTTGGSMRYKLCDFGSTAPPTPAATTPAECRAIEDDVQKHTTLQYRSPEMIDVYRKQPIDEKSDIWALGVLLYKLCYYTTPFEEKGQLAILNASFKFPSYPVFSDTLKKLIASMLRENPKSRPNIYQVLREGCLMRGKEVPIRDIYASRAQSEPRRDQKLPTQMSDASSAPTVGAVFSPPTKEQAVIPVVVPMRRGRPTTTPSSHMSKPSPSPLRGSKSDPFAALDGKSSPPKDEISARFPPLDQFSLLHDQGNRFEFQTSPTTSKPKDLSQRVTERLADDAFITSAQTRINTVPQNNLSPSGPSRASQIISSHPALQSPPSGPILQEKITTTSRPVMISQGTMTSPDELPATESQFPKQNTIPSYRFQPKSDSHRSSSLPRDQAGLSSSISGHTAEQNTSNPTNTIRRNAKSQLQINDTKQTSSSRPSLESGRPSMDQLDPVSRTKSADSRSRPSSTNLESSVDYLRERESGSSWPSLRKGTPPSQAKVADSIVDADPELEEDGDVQSNVAFLRSREDQDSSRRKDKRASGEVKQPKRSSMNSKITGTKALLAGKFGDAFKRFEASNVPPPPRTPSPLKALDRREPTPLADFDDEDEDNLSAEQRRELERRRLSLEEKRVEAAKAEYRQRLDSRDNGGPPPPRSIGGQSKAASIQNKVKTLLDETQKSTSAKTAEGYGRYTDTPAPQARPFDDRPQLSAKPTIARKPVIPTQPSTQLHPSHSAPQLDDPSTMFPATIRHTPTAPAPLPIPNRSVTNPGPRPSAPPKPTHLSSSPPKATIPPMSRAQESRDDYVSDFSRRFPSLSGIELVETVVGVREPAGYRDAMEDGDGEELLGRSREV